MDQEQMVQIWLADQFCRENPKPSEIAAIAHSLLKKEQGEAEQRRRANLKNAKVDPILWTKK